MASTIEPTRSKRSEDARLVLTWAKTFRKLSRANRPEAEVDAAAEFACNAARRLIGEGCDPKNFRRYEFAHLPICVPVMWKDARGRNWLAYHHGWSDARMHNVITTEKTPRFMLRHPDEWLGIIDDFGDLVRTGHAWAGVRWEQLQDHH